MLLLVDDRDDVADVVTFREPAGHQVHRIVARRGDQGIGPVDPRVLEHRFVGRVSGDGENVVVLQDIARTFLVLVDHHHGVAGIHGDRSQIPADSAKADDDGVHPSGFNRQH